MRIPPAQWAYIALRLLKNTLLAVPGVARLDQSRHARRTGDMNDPEYVVSILSGHLRRLMDARDLRAGTAESPRPTPFAFPGIAMVGGLRALEMGPGASLGQAFLLCLLGAERVTAVDVRGYATAETGGGVYRKISESLDGWIESGRLPPSALDPQTRREREGELLERSESFPNLGGSLHYELTDGRSLPLPDSSLDFIYSCSVLEHVVDPAHLYREQARVLVEGGVCSHIIDLRDHHHADPFDFLRYDERLWRWMQSRSAGFTNRLRRSDHLRLMEKAGLEVLTVEDRQAEAPPPPARLSREFRGYPPEELRRLTLVVTGRNRSSTGGRRGKSW
jgi:SAM-dependent methyltransferase